SMDLQSDCLAIGSIDIPRGQTTYLNGKAPPGTSGTRIASCRLMFKPETDGDTLEVKLLSGAYIENCETSLGITLTGNPLYTLGCESDSRDFPSFEAQNGEANVVFKRETIGVTNYQFQVMVKASRTIAKEPPGGGNSANVGMIVGIIVGVIVLIIILCIICICCHRRRKESQKEKAQFVNGGAANVQVVTVQGSEKDGVYNGRVNSESPGSSRRLLGRGQGGSEDGGESGDGRSRSALERFGPAPSQRRRPDDRDSGRRREVFQTDNEVGTRRPHPQPRVGLQRGVASQDYEDVDDRGDANGSPRASPLLSDLRNNPKFRRSFHENEVDADERVRRMSDRTTSSSGDSQEGGSPRRPNMPAVPRSPSRSPSPQRRGEKIATIFRSRPSSSHDAARLDSDPTVETPPIEEREVRDTRHTLRPNRNGRNGRPSRDEFRRGRSRGDEDYDDDEEEEEEERRRQQRRRDREDEERQRRKRQEEEEEEREEEERRRKQEKKRKEEERRRKEEEEEREEERRRKLEKKRKEEEKRRREEEEEEDRRRRRAAKESDGSEYEGRFKKSASGRKSKGKAPRMGRSRSTGNALEEMEDRYQRSRSKSPGSTHSLNFIEGDEDETDLDSNYMPFRRAGSKTSLYASRSSLYGRRRKNSMGETVSVSSRTALDDTDSRMGDFDKSRMSQTELRRLFKSTGELEMRPESAHVVREVGTSTTRGGSVSVYGRNTVAKSRRGKRYSRGTQTPQSRGDRDRRDSVGSAKSGRSTGSRHRLKSKSRSRESLGGRRSRSRALSDDEDSDSDDRRGRHRAASRSRSREKLDAATDDSGDDRSKRSGRSGRRHKKSRHLSASDEDDHIADDQSMAPSSVAPSSLYGAAPQAYAPYPQMVTGPGYPQLVYQPVVAPGGPPVPPPGMMYQMAAPAQPQVAPQKPPIAPKPTAAKPKPTGSRWDELVNLTDGMKQRRRQMGESVTEDGTESVLSSMWSQPTYTKQAPKAPPSYNTAQRLVGPDLSYSSNYPDSSGVGLTPPRDGRNMRMASYSPSESNV
ncbi:hypothetical protein PoB_001536100, partial [Plakobranchus ocellatus]